MLLVLPGLIAVLTVTAAPAPRRREGNTEGPVRPSMPPPVRLPGALRFVVMPLSRIAQSDERATRPDRPT
jgi:hypothetical protein